MDKVLLFCPCNNLSKILVNVIGFINIGSLVTKLFSKQTFCLHLSMISCSYYTLYQNINFFMPGVCDVNQGYYLRKNTSYNLRSITKNTFTNTLTKP